MSPELITHLNNLANLVNSNVRYLECDVNEYRVIMSLVNDEVKALVNDKSGTLIHSLVKVNTN